MLENFQSILGIKLSSLSIILGSLIITISLVIQAFSKNYLEGDSQKKAFFVSINLLTLTVLLIVLSNNLWLFFFSWLASNLLLVKLMIHKSKWKQALNSGFLTLNFFAFGFGTLLLAILLISNIFGISNISELSTVDYSSTLTIFNYEFGALTLISLLLIITAMVQSAQIPFSNWLLSSLNSPTPVSAFMHAGLVNGGGILLIKFAPAYLNSGDAMNFIFIIGSITAIFGSSTMLVQTKIKNKLASSTVGQMGFMFMQIGMGLLPAAIVHLFMHGFFKAFSFLNAGSSVKKVKLSNESHEPIKNFILALIWTSFLTLLFSEISGYSLTDGDTKSLQCLFVFIALCQFIFSAIKTNQSTAFKSGLFLLSIVFVIGYGFFIHLADSFMADLMIFNAQGLNAIHIITAAIFLVFWLINNLAQNTKDPQRILQKPFIKRVYMALVNLSQPDLSTITSKRKDYSF